MKTFITISLFLFSLSILGQTDYLSNLCSEVNKYQYRTTYTIDSQKVKNIPDFTVENLLGKYNERYLGIPDSFVVMSKVDCKRNKACDSTIYLHRVKRFHKGYKVNSIFTIRTKNNIVSEVRSTCIPIDVDTAIRITKMEAVDLARNHWLEATGDSLFAILFGKILYPKERKITLRIGPTISRKNYDHRAEDYSLVYQFNLISDYIASTGCRYYSVSVDAVNAKVINFYDQTIEHNPTKASIEKPAFIPSPQRPDNKVIQAIAKSISPPNDKQEVRITLKQDVIIDPLTFFDEYKEAFGLTEFDEMKLVA